MIRISNTNKVKPGDILLVHREMWDKAKQKPYTWRYFVIVSAQPMRSFIYGQRVVPTNEGSIDTMINLQRSAKLNVFLLNEKEIPDGVHQVRMERVLKGELEV